MTTNNSDQIEIIDGSHGSFDIAAIWRYKDLLWLLIKRDFVAFYKQTIFGPLWFFIQPVFTTVVFVLLFNNIAGISTEGLPAPLFYMSGITLWNYFADCLLKTSTVFKDNANIFGKVYFPRMIMPISIVLSNLVRFIIQFILFLCFYCYYLATGQISFEINFYLILLPFLILLMACLGLGMGLIISALTTKYRDLSFLVSFGVQLFMYATTVAYPLSAAPEKIRFWVGLNPMSTIIESFRLVWFGTGHIEYATILLHTVIIFCILVVGVWVFTRVERDFMDTV